MKPSRPLVIMGTISAVAILAMVLVDLVQPVPPQDRLRSLRDEMSSLRFAADSCRLALDTEESRLRASDARLDSLRSRIDFFESLDPRGVPADSYQLYMRAFDAYNARIPGRAAAGDTLKAHLESCRAIIEQHNLIADSALDLARDLGLLRDSAVRSPSTSTPDSAPADASPPETLETRLRSGRRP